MNKKRNLATQFLQKQQTTKKTNELNKNKGHNLKNHQLTLRQTDANLFDDEFRKQPNPKSMVINTSLDFGRIPMQIPLIPMIANLDTILTHNPMN